MYVRTPAITRLTAAVIAVVLSSGCLYVKPSPPLSRPGIAIASQCAVPTSGPAADRRSPSRQEVIDFMQAVKEGVRQCGHRHDAQQDIVLDVDVAGATGGVSRLRVRSDATDDPTTCIAQLFDTPCFEPFGNELFTVRYPFRTR